MGFARAGTLIFWKSHGLQHDDTIAEPEIELEQVDQDDAPAAPRAPALPFVATFGLLAGLVALTVFAGPMTRYTTATAQDLFAPEAYIETVLANRDRPVVDPAKADGYGSDDSHDDAAQIQEEGH
jgi:multicomponent K+:H+ antiporter subunit D